MQCFTFVEHWFQPTESREGRRCERADHREIIVSMMRRHYDMHTNIPVEGEAYNFCKEHNLRDAWAYLYNRWYKESWWKRWARSSRVAIPIGKTTMMIESQWRIPKRDFLVNSIRPRLDYLVWIIIQKQIVTIYQTFSLKIVNRTQTLVWELEFVREWHTKTSRGEPGSNSRCNRSENDNAEELYLPSIENWTHPSLRVVFGAHDYFICRQSTVPYVQILPNTSYPFYGLAAPNTVSLPQQTLPITPNSPPQTTIIPQSQPQPQPQPASILTPMLPPVITISDSEEEAGEELEAAVVVENNDEEIEAEEIEEVEEVEPQQQQFFDTSHTRDRHVNNYFNVVNAYRNRRTCDRTWEDDHPFTHYL
ncbi:hypothetical protein INT45_009096 [Circinella minor]|uniref:Uncharacterized protein n=1 Tax=Circinella minor TaxID=1195481 RepID=A0A8H7RUM0_9FUNG|nr:hypothetical protein INT45_009096 [Circinella minor]